MRESNAARLCLEYFSVNSILFFSIHELTRRYPAVLSSFKSSAGAGQARKHETFGEIFKMI